MPFNWESFNIFRGIPSVSTQCPTSPCGEGRGVFNSRKNGRGEVVNATQHLAFKKFATNKFG
jgi:hypothetical protein